MTGRVNYSKRPHRRPWRGSAGRTARHLALYLFAALLPVVLAVPSSGAQGQTPETPRPLPGTGQTGSGYTGGQPLPSSRPIRYQQRIPDEQQDDRGTGRQGTGTSTDRFAPRDTGRSAEPGPAGEQPGVAPPGPRPAEGAGPAEAPRPVTGPTGPTGPSISGPGLSRPGAPGVVGGPPGMGAGAGGARFSTPQGGAAVSVTGQGTFEPALLHDVEYPDVPDVGEENILTEEGPMSVEQFLGLIHFATDWNIVVTDAAKQVNLNFFIVETPPKQALKVLEKHRVYYEFDEEAKFLYVMTEEEHLFDKYAKLQSHQFQVVYADVSYAESMLSSLLSSLGRIITDQRTHNIYVWDTRDNLDQMIKTFDDIDVPLQKRSYTVVFADIADIEGVVTSLLSPNGRLLADARTGQMVVWDAPTMLDQVDEAIERLDVPIEPVSYDIRYVEAEDLIDSLEVLLSERGQIVADPRYNTIIVTDLPVRQKRIADMIATLDRELETRTWVIRYADVDFVADQIETYIPRDMGEIVVNDLVHQITVTGLPERLDKIDQLIQTWDIRRRQVMIEAFLVDMGESATHDLNVSWSYFSSSGGSPVVVNSPNNAFPGVNRDLVTIGQLPYAVPLYGNLQLDSSGNITRPVLTDIQGNTIIDRFAGNKLGVALSYLEQTTNTKLLAAPRVTVQDGEEAIFENAERVPYSSGSTSYSSFNYGGGTTSRVEFVNVGIILRVRPRISESDDILLDIAAEDSSAELVEIESFTTSGTDNITSRKAPQVKARNVETQLRVQSGDTVVLGGLRQNRSGETLNKVPVLGDIPLVGRLFRSPARDSTNTTLMIFLTPTIVDEQTFPEAEMLARADELLAQEHRHNMKSLYQRILDRVSRGETEFGISIGQAGDIHSEGQRVSVDDLRTALFGVNIPGKVTAVIRHHPRAPAPVLTQVTEVVMEAGLKIEFDDRMSPLVPRQRAGGQQAAAAAPEL